MSWLKHRPQFLLNAEILERVSTPFFLRLVRCFSYAWVLFRKDYSISFSGFPVGCCINREKVICYQLEFRKITLPTFRLNAPVETGEMSAKLFSKLKLVTDNLYLYSISICNCFTPSNVSPMQNVTNQTRRCVSWDFDYEGISWCFLS